MHAVWVGRALYAAAFGGGAALVFKGDDLADSLSDVVKWGAVAGGVYLAGKYMKAW